MCVRTRPCKPTPHAQLLSWAAKNGLDHTFFKETLPPLAAAVRHSVAATRDALLQQMAAASCGQADAPDAHLLRLYGCEADAVPQTMTLPSVTAAMEVCFQLYNTWLHVAD